MRNNFSLLSIVLCLALSSGVLGVKSAQAQPPVDQCSVNTPLATVPAGLLTDTIVVNEDWTIDDIAVGVDITHPFVGQLIVELRSPANTVLRLHDEGGFNADDIALTFRDSGVANATQNFNCGCDMQPSGFGGQGALSDFASESSAGVWTLEVVDLSAQNTGTLNSWCLQMESDDPTFIRGDTTSDADIQLNDVIVLLGYLFVPGSVVPFCLDAADVDDGGTTDLNDAVHLLQYLYLPSSPEPPAPFDQCGLDPTTDTLTTCFPAPGC